MRHYYVTFRSVTFAQRARRLLEQEGYRCALQRTPRWMEAQGCGYCLRFWLENIAQPVRILREGGIPVRKIYIQQDDGRLEEVKP